jgi:RNA polymerase sigma-70 factor (ECF subfamily)
LRTSDSSAWECPCPSDDSSKAGGSSDHISIEAVQSLRETPLRIPAADLPAPSVDLISIHRDHADFVWLSLLRLGVQPADAEDLLQEVFVVVHRRLQSFDRSARITTWLYGICIRVAAAYQRRAHRRHERSVADVPEGPAFEEAPEQAASARQARAHLERVLDAMDIEKRAVFVMYELDEMPCEEIAQVLGVPIGTVYSRLHAARKAFEEAVVRVNARAAAVPLRGARR